MRGRFRSTCRTRAPRYRRRAAPRLARSPARTGARRRKARSPQAARSVWRPWPGFAAPHRARWRRRSRRALRRRLCGERTKISPAPERAPIHPAPAAGRTGPSRRWRRTGTRRRDGAWPIRYRPSGRAKVRNRRTGVRRWLRRERSSARKRHPYDFYPVEFSIGSGCAVILGPGSPLSSPVRNSSGGAFWRLACQITRQKRVRAALCTMRDSARSATARNGGIVYINQLSVILTVVHKAHLDWTLHP